MIASPIILACATCYGDPNSALTHGMNLGILTLLGVTLAVLGGIAAGMIVLARRARHQAEIEAAVEELLKETSS